MAAGAGSVVLNCKCEHKEQDKMYGKGKRLFNYCADNASARCTVCNTINKTGENKNKK